jgi:hypothetical protein
MVLFWVLGKESVGRGPPETIADMLKVTIDGGTIGNPRGESWQPQETFSIIVVDLGASFS